jgi:D-alanyl-D-alanine carboxypeptidase
MRFQGRASQQRTATAPPAPPGGAGERGARLRVTALLAILSLAFVGGHVAPAAGQGTDDTALRASLRTALTDFLSSQGAVEHISAVSLRVTFRGQRPAINVPVGTTLYGGGRPIAANSLWQIGSNTKAFTSVMLLQLEAEHKLSIHDTLGKWLPRYRAWRHIRIKRLLNMTSGIPDYFRPAFQRAYTAAPNTEFSPSRMVSYGVHGRLHRGYYYSNTSYILAQMILEKATHDTYAHQLQKRIAKPLGLRSLSYRPTPYPRAVLDRMPAGYFFTLGMAHTRPLLGHDLSRFNLSYAAGAGGIVSSLADVSKWERALYAGRMLPGKQQRELESVVSQKTGKPVKRLTSTDPQGYGLGVAQGLHPTLGRFWFYEGETFAFRLLHIYFPRSGTLIDIAVNSSTNHDLLSSLGESISVILQGSGVA